MMERADFSVAEKPCHFGDRQASFLQIALRKIASQLIKNSGERYSFFLQATRERPLTNAQPPSDFRHVCLIMRKKCCNRVFHSRAPDARFGMATSDDFVAISNQKRIEIWIRAGDRRAGGGYRKRHFIDAIPESDAVAQYSPTVWRDPGAMVSKFHAHRSEVITRKLSAYSQQCHGKEFDLMTIMPSHDVSILKHDRHNVAFTILDADPFIVYRAVSRQISQRRTQCIARCRHIKKQPQLTEVQFLREPHPEKLILQRTCSKVEKFDLTAYGDSNGWIVGFLHRKASPLE